jgi:hypothetical protein
MLMIYYAYPNPTDSLATCNRHINTTLSKLSFSGLESVSMTGQMNISHLPYCNYGEQFGSTIRRYKREHLKLQADSIWNLYPFPMLQQQQGMRQGGTSRGHGCPQHEKIPMVFLKMKLLMNSK